MERSPPFFRTVYPNRKHVTTHPDYCKCPVALPHGANGGSAVCDCDISRSVKTNEMFGVFMTKKRDHTFAIFFFFYKTVPLSLTMSAI